MPDLQPKQMTWQDVGDYIDKVFEQHAAMRAMLERLANVTWGDDDFCPVCQFMGDGHTPNCELAALLKQMRGDDAN